MADALLIVDVQNDFVPPDGALAVSGGDQVIDPINALARSGTFDLIVATRDWHPPDHYSFRGQGGPWPEHCVRDTQGAQLDTRLERDAIDVVIDTGTSRCASGCSAFESTRLLELLGEQDVDHLTVTGLATDVCVRHTALDALKAGLRVTVPTTAVRGIDAQDSARSLEELGRAGAEVV